MTFKIVTLGCKVNNYESEYMTELLIKNNYFYNEENSDIIIINTCSVTNQADSKSRKLIRKAKKDSPHAIIIVCGCMAENHQRTLDLPIDILIGNKDKSKIIDYLNEYLINKNKIKKFYNLRTVEFEDMTLDSYQNKTRAFVKIEDGCNNFCSYCIIPYVRGKERSKEFFKVIEEVETLVKNGHQEIVLTGIHTGNYNSNGKRLIDIIKKISKIDNLKRIRISSIEVTELDSDFLEELKNNSKICNHLHIPLQSGSDNILKLMNRKYDLKYYEDKIRQIRAIRPDINITTDIIVGFPNETDEDFNNTLEFSEKIKFGKIHVFPYSKRDGTQASLMTQVKDDVKKKRTNNLLELSFKLELEYQNKFLGQELDILIEKVENHLAIGHTSNYLEIKIKGNLEKNKIYYLEIVNVDPLEGKVVDKIVI